MPTRRLSMVLAGAAIGLSLLAASGCGSSNKKKSAPVEEQTTPDGVLSGVAGHQATGIYANDLVGGETTAVGTSSGGIYQIRHGFYMPPPHRLPFGAG